MKTYTCKHCGFETTNRYELTGHVTKMHAKTKLSLREASLREERVDEYLLNPSFCKECGQQLEYDDRHKKFCNNSCSASYNNRRRRTISTFICKGCGQEFPKKYPSQKRSYCSNSCQGKYKKLQTVESWLKTGHLLLSIAGQICNSKTVKEYILTDQGGVCGICGNMPIWNGKPLSFILDHIDGDSTHNDRENLRMICPNCDVQLDTYKARNKGKGRRSKGFSTNAGF